MLDDLYQSLILDHSAKPRNFGPLAEASHQADGYNPLCGDRITVHVRVDGETIEGITFVGSGCAISKASASLMTESVRGKSVPQAEALFAVFRSLVMGDESVKPPPAADALSLGKLEALSGVKGFPMRVKCATLAWHTLQAALARQAAPVKTE